jgi:L-alanine-DL-glutamate epimerase-like enolase superfamily enzyme
VDASSPKIRSLRATPVNVPLAPPHPTEVMVDHNQSLSVPEAIRRVQLLEEEALVWVEEPTRADDFAGHARIAAECRTPIQTEAGCGLAWDMDAVEHYRLR